jgi:hypothetical protein
VLPNNPRRVFARILNLSAGNIFVDFKENPTSTTGIPIGPNGGFLEMSVEDDGEAVAWEVRGIAALAGSQLHVYTVERV